jgi:DNA-directed RNA polymerase beta subunit
MAYLKNMDVDDKSHKFLAEELLIPNVDKCDLSRANMFTNHVVQALVPNHGETPQVFTGFENQVGEYSQSMKKFDVKMKVLSIIEKNSHNAMYILQEVKSKKVHVVEKRTHGRITEHYGYALNTEVLDTLEEGDIVEPDVTLVHSSSHDEHGSLRYGLNLNTLYATMHGLNYEDGIIISESAREKMTYETVEEIVVTINNNDILVNYFGDNNKYKCFPDIGEFTKDGILCSRRRVNYESAFVDLSNRSLKAINFTNDTIFYAKGRIVDIIVYANVDEETLGAHVYNTQIVKYQQMERDYHERVTAALAPLVEGKECDKHFTPEVAYIYSRSKGIAAGKKWTFEKSEYDGVVIKFVVAYTEKVVVGSKVTNRYGGKGVISKIIPDAEMPATSDGRIAEVIISCLGVINRLNPASLVEIELTFIARKVAERAKELNSTVEAADYIIDFISRINERQAESFREMLDSLEPAMFDRAIMQMIEEGIPIHQPPFFGSIRLQQIHSMYQYYGFEPDKLVGIETPMLMGKMYFLILKHHPASKFSARSARYISIKEVPSKNTRDYKAGQALYSTTPVRLGEQELVCMMLLKNPEELFRFIRQTSSNRDDRETLIHTLLTEDPYNIQRIEISDNSESHTMSILNAYLTSIGLQLVED